MGSDLKTRLAKSREDARMLCGNLLGIQRRMRAVKPGWETEVFLTLNRLISAAGSIEATLNMVEINTDPAMKDSVPELVGFFGRLRVMPKETADGLSALAAAKRLGVSVSTIQEMLKDGRLRGKKIGKMWRIRPDSIDRLVKKSTVTRPGRTDVISPAIILNRKSSTHEWTDDANTVKCVCCGLTVPAALPWKQQLGFAELNACLTNKE